MRLSLRNLATVSLLMLLASASGALAQGSYDPISIDAVRVGHAKVVLQLQAGETGAPNGFRVWWMKSSDFFGVYGGSWPAGPAAGKFWGLFNGTPTLNTMDGSLTTYRLAPNQMVQLEVGDLFDESGFSGNSPVELDYGVEYVFCVAAEGDVAYGGSTWSRTIASTTTLNTNCTFTVGYWKNHPEAWPVSGLTLGTVAYTAAELMSILNEPVAGNGLISLAHQLIAAKLNVANGADPSFIAATIASADAQIGALVVPPVGSGYLSPASTSSKTQTLDDWNNGITGPGHCGETPTAPTTWGRLKQLFR